MIRIPLKNGNTIICGAGEKYAYGGYLQLVDKNENELLYYDIEEWKREPEQVVGAFMRRCSEE